MMLKGVLPKPTPETRHFWDGCLAGELRLQRCAYCQSAYFPPRPFCPACRSQKVEVFAASGKATLYSFVVDHSSGVGGDPYVVATVQLAEGPRMLTNIVETSQTGEMLMLDMLLDVTFDRVSEDIALPKFRPARASQ